MSGKAGKVKRSRNQITLAGKRLARARHIFHLLVHREILDRDSLYRISLIALEYKLYAENTHWSMVGYSLMRAKWRIETGQHRNGGRRGWHEWLLRGKWGRAWAA